MNRIKWFGAVRVYGLFLVLGYHLFYGAFPGGFLGVDIFFTFSGFLITALILEEVRKNKKFALFQFYKRRVRRVAIPLFFAVVFTLPFLLLISPDFSVGIAKQVTAAFGFVTNWVEIFTGGSYEAQMLPSVYIHIWSLAVEMQFYLAWGLLCALLALLSNVTARKSGKSGFACFRLSVAGISGALALGSYLLTQSMYNANASLNAIYFNTFTRLLPFFIGALAAAVWGLREDREIADAPRPRHAKLKTAALIASVLLAAVLIFGEALRFKFGDAYIYRFGFLVTPLLTVGIISGAHGLHNLTPPHVKEPKLLTAGADLSYDAYLYHWPFYIVFSALILNNTVAALLTLAATFLFSAFSFYVAERVFGARHYRQRLKHRGFAVSAVLVAVIFSAAMGGLVIGRAPAMTSIETDFAVNNVAQDARNVASLAQNLGAVKQIPVVYAADETPLQAKLLPADDTVPAFGEQAQPPSPPPEPAPPERPAGVTLIGDSVALGAQTALVKAIPDCSVDAQVSRATAAGIDVLADLQAKGELREYVVIALGTNGSSDYEKQLTQIIDLIEPGHRLVFVTPFDGRANENAKLTNATAEWERTLPDQYDFVTIADWNALAGEHLDALAKDKVHMGGDSARELYTGCVAAALNIAAGKPAKEGI
ncbi:MAG: acyltransferase [Firmicutes bacterium]|nr:acyltransferase [Bacillota bacterium]